MRFFTSFFSLFPFSLFERAIAYVGRDFQSHALWDKYLEFESVHGTKQNVRYLYERILTMPCKELHQYHEKYVLTRILISVVPSPFDKSWQRDTTSVPRS